MTTLQKAEALLSDMTRAEKVRLVERIVRELSGAFPGIESTPGVAGGDPCIADSRIPVWALVQYRKLGASEADLLRMYPTLHAEDLTNAWAYYSSYPNEIDQQIQANETA
ncbi:MAG: DUF433 domain-containing protein [Chloroflexi bacterium]|nr:DUF433 domain-containing protein [Chloroflexota bacterium]